MWKTLSEPWRACGQLAWESYRAGSLPIGAVVADVDGRLMSYGRNRIHERSGPPGAVFGRKLAHAELNALLSFEGDEDSRARVVYTTTEPCPLCAGAHCGRWRAQVRLQRAVGRVSRHLRDGALPATR